MAGWKRVLSALVNNAEEHFDQLTARLRRRLAHDDNPVKILPYIGFGTPQDLYLRGRVLEDYNVAAGQDSDSTWRNLVNMYRRFNTREVKAARVRATLGDQVRDVITNDEGFFEVHLQPEQPPTVSHHRVMLDLHLIDPTGEPGSHATGEVILPAPDAKFGIISDIDDTVLRTDVLHVMKMARNTFLRNAHTRLPFAGVAEFYQALQRGRGTYNPIFYVSNSMWNLYDLFIDFFEVRGIPLGALFLIDAGFNEEYLSGLRSGSHKLKWIQTVMQSYNNLPFILIGDSGEKDPEIYLQVVQQFPGRVLTVYIRNVYNRARDREKRERQVQTIIDQVNRAGAEMLLVPDTYAAALHAAERGIINADSLAAIGAARTEDSEPPAAPESLVDELDEE